MGMKEAAMVKQLGALVDMVNRVPMMKPTVKLQMLAGAKQGMVDRISELKKDGADVTLESVMDNFKANNGFLMVCRKMDITLDDLEKMAGEAISDASN